MSNIRKSDKKSISGDGAAKQISAAKWRFLQRMAADKSVTAPEFKILFAIVNCYNRTRGYAWPSYSDLAKYTALSPATIGRGVGSLDQKGKILRKSGGRGRANEYVPAFSLADLDPAQAECTQGELSSQVSANLTHSYERTPHSLVSDHTLNPLSNSEGDIRVSPFGEGALAAPPLGGEGRKQDSLLGFEAFWAAYPKKEHHKKARAAYAEVMASGEATPAEILAKAQEYALAKADVDPQYLSLPENWLRGTSWRYDTWKAPKPKGAKKSKSKIEERPPQPKEVGAKQAPPPPNLDAIPGGPTDDLAQTRVTRGKGHAGCEFNGYLRLAGTEGGQIAYYDPASWEPKTKLLAPASGLRNVTWYDGDDDIGMVLDNTVGNLFKSGLYLGSAQISLPERGLVSVGMVLPPEGDGFVLIEFFSDNGAKERRRVNVSELKCVEWWFQPVPDDEDDPASPAKKLPDFIKVGAYFTDIDGGSPSRVVAISDDFGVEFEYICDIRNIIDTDAFTPEECKSLGEWFRPSTEDERWLFEVNEIRALIKDGASVWLPKVGKLGRADRCVEGLATISFVDDYGNNRLLTRQAISELAPASPWPRKPERPAAEGLAAVAEAAE